VGGTEEEKNVKAEDMTSVAIFTLFVEDLHTEGGVQSAWEREGEETKSLGKKDRGGG